MNLVINKPSPTYITANDEMFGNEIWTIEQQNNMPYCNIIEEEDKFIIEILAPGMMNSDFKISVMNGILDVSSEKKTKSLEENESYRRQEFVLSTFNRSF